MIPSRANLMATSRTCGMSGRHAFASIRRATSDGQTVFAGSRSASNARMAERTFDPSVMKGQLSLPAVAVSLARSSWATLRRFSTSMLFHHTAGLIPIIITLA